MCHIWRMTLRLPPVRNEWYRGQDRYRTWTRQKLKDEVLTDEIIFSSDELAGETISAHEWVNTSGPTISADAINGDSDGVTFTVTGCGTTTLSVTTSGGRTLRKKLRWLGLDAGNFHDYGG